MRVWFAPALLLVAASLLSASDKEGRRLFTEGQKAERAGDIVRAYLLYSQAVTQDPQNLDYWLRSQALRVQATLRAKPAGARTPASAASAPTVDTPASASAASGEPLAWAREPQPPPELKASPQRRNLDLRGDAKTLFTQVARAYGLDVVFDSDYQPGPALHFRLDNADYREALHALEAATASFLAPVGERLLLVAKDTPQKRIEAEPIVSVAVPVPEPVSLQDAQETMQRVQQTMALQQVGFDSQRRIILARDRLSKVRPAQALIEQLLRHRALVSIEVEFVESSRGSSTSYGASLQTLFSLLNFGGPWNSAPSIPAGLTRFLVFGGGKTFLGLGLTDAQLFARMSSAAGRTLYRTEIRSVDGQPASVHVGEQYPVVTAKYLSSGSGGQLSVPPAFNFEELGLVIKVTPHVNGSSEVTLDLETEFKALTGQSFNDVPVVASRKLQSQVRLRNGEWAVIAGLMSASQARTISGLAGLSRVPLLGPLLGQNTRDESESQVLVVIKPALLSLPPSEAATRVVPLGAEQRPRTSL
jgi:general secretion pathway protein D